MKSFKDYIELKEDHHEKNHYHATTGNSYVQTHWALFGSGLFIRPFIVLRGISHQVGCQLDVMQITPVPAAIVKTTVVKMAEVSGNLGPGRL